jgi:phosphonate transport system substrate-binding protein
VALGIFAATSSEPVLRASMLPSESPTVLRKKFKPLADYLEQKIGMKIEFRPSANAEDLVEKLATNKLDFVWFSGFNFIQAKLRSNGQVTPITQRAKEAQTQSVFITTDENITHLKHLKGKKFAFGDKTSTSDHLMPRAFLQAVYIDPNIDMEDVIYLNSNDAVIAAVTSSMVDAGVLSVAAWKKRLANGKVDPKVLHRFYTTPGYSNYNWAARADMDTKLRQKLTDAFVLLNRHNAKEKWILDLQETNQFIPTNAENYSTIEAMARRAELLQ